MMRLLMGLLWTMILVLLWNQDGRVDAASAPASATTDWPTEAKGYGFDPKKVKGNALKLAREDALRVAQKEIVKCLRRHQPPVTAWVPTTDYIEKNLVAKEREDKNWDEKEGTAQEIVLFLKAPDWEQVYRLEREAQEIERAQRSKKRLVILARAFAALLVLLAAVAGCIRLDDWTRGAYRRWLQLAGAGLVAAAWAGLWLLI
jgi:hypothetical protein